MGKVLKHIALTALLAMDAWSVDSCNTTGCTDLRSSIPQAGFYSSATAEKVTLDSLEISGVGVPGDSVLLSPGSPVQSVYLPMRTDSDITAWCIKYKYHDLDRDALNDTLTLRYETKPFFASNECGVMYQYDLKSVDVTTHLIDSVKVVEPLITNNDHIQLQIYFRMQQ